MSCYFQGLSNGTKNVEIYIFNIQHLLIFHKSMQNHLNCKIQVNRQYTQLYNKTTFFLKWIVFL